MNSDLGGGGWLASPEPRNDWPSAPTDFAETFQRIKQMVFDLSWTWKLYRQLYIDPGTVDLLNHWARMFFASCQNMMQDYIILCLGRLTDKARIRGHETLSLHRLKELADQWGNKALSDSLREHIGVVCCRVKAIRIHRDKRVAHADAKAQRLPPLNVQSVGAAIDSIQALLQSIESIFTDTETSWEPVGTGDGEHLVFALRMASAYSERNKQALIEHGTNWLREDGLLASA